MPSVKWVCVVDEARRIAANIAKPPEFLIF
jgi:hypothetical protein